MPPGLKNLTGPLKALVDFLRIDSALVEAAARASSTLETGMTHDDLAVWLRQMPESQKDALLLDAALNNTLNLRAELLRRYAHDRVLHHAGNRWRLVSAQMGCFSFRGVASTVAASQSSGGTRSEGKR